MVGAASPAGRFPGSRSITFSVGAAKAKILKRISSASARSATEPCMPDWNCRVAVSLSISTAEASLSIAWRLYLPEVWANDEARRQEAGIPQEVRFQTKLAIALIKSALREARNPHASVLANAAYGADTRFREGITDLGLP